jgi:predicted metalloprotease
LTRRPLLFLCALLALVSFAAALAACGGGDDDDDDRDDDSRPEDSDRDGVRDSRDDCRNEDEDEGLWGSDANDGCPGTIDDLVELARADIDFFWQSQFENDTTLYEPPLQFTAYTTEIETACGLAVPENAFYCSADHSIYYDVNFLARELETNGDFGPVLIIAHEWGHLVQSLLGILGSTELLTIQTELQADCLAGVWAADADQRGLLEEGDFEEGMIALLRVGDPHGTDFFDPQAHGQPEERVGAYRRGFFEGLDGCTLD